MANKSFVFEFLEFIKVRKRYWLLPIFIAIIILGGIIVFTQSSAIAPFIYVLF